MYELYLRLGQLPTATQFRMSVHVDELQLELQQMTVTENTWYDCPGG